MIYNTQHTYHLILDEMNCVSNRATCDHNCKSCPFYNDPKYMLEALRTCITLIKAKDPTLYLADDLTSLREGLKRYADNQNKKTE